MYQSARLFDLDTNTGICIQKAPYIIYHIRKVASTNNLKKIKTTFPSASKESVAFFILTVRRFSLLGIVRRHGLIVRLLIALPYGRYQFLNHL